jgi:hypothetical protein
VQHQVTQLTADIASFRNATEDNLAVMTSQQFLCTQRILNALKDTGRMMDHIDTTGLQTEFTARTYQLGLAQGFVFSMVVCVFLAIRLREILER